MIEHQRDTKTPGITANHALLTNEWTMEVRSLEAALARVKPDEGVNSRCRVTFFEVVGDGDLHVNVLHHSATEGVNGWAGPGVIPDGVVYNRTFNHIPRYQVLRQIKNMIFAAVPS